MNMKRMKCRVWWPKQLSSQEQPESAVLFGWFIPSSPVSLDVVVVAIVVSPEQISLHHDQDDLQGILHCTNGKMPPSLQDKSTFSILGHCAADCSSSGQFQGVGMEEDGPSKTYCSIYPQNSQDLFGDSYGGWSCGCHKFGKPLEQCRELSIRNGNWIHLSYDSHGNACKDIDWIPRLHHFHWDGRLVSSCDVHVIIYEPPTFGVHHFSLNSWGSPEQVRTHLKRPMWVDELHQKQPLPDLNTVILAINCATAAKIVVESCLFTKGSFHQFPIVSMLATITWYLMAIFLASFFTLFYIILQFFHSFMSYGSQWLICTILAKVFSHTWKNIHIRSCQLMYWPVLLQSSGFRSVSSVEYAHRAALHKHSMWSSIAVDVLLGNVVGLALLFHIETACQWVLNLVHDGTNNLLRSGCVWLMGIPAGFKLNTELAEILGMVSLNAIQIWSTLWFFVGFHLKYFIKGLALLGIVFGMTIPASLIIDMIMLATLHVSTLHWLISLVYSQQIQALAALWRLFRGRKWNPLRQRFDSYNYTVEQHVVGSLLFTPLLLLLPTTSVFYMFFTILNTAISFICILIEVTISILHATPYTEIFLWMIRPRRFPSGIWFEIISGRGSNTISSTVIGCFNEDCSSTRNSPQRKMWQENRKGAGILLLFLRSNFSSIGQIILPHYKNVFRSVPTSFGTSSAYGVLIGRRIPAALRTGFPSTMPWMLITYKEYWQLCFDSVLTCMSDRNHGAHS